MRGGDSTGTKPIPLGGEAQGSLGGKDQGSKRDGAGGDRCTASILLSLMERRRRKIEGQSRRLKITATMAMVRRRQEAHFVAI